jgi:copper chaperone NosL
MRMFFRSLALCVLVAIAASCSQNQVSQAPPAPHEISSDSVGHFCGMSLVEHPGPKGQIWLSGQAGPVWFASVTEVFAFTMLDEEPKNIAAIYVTDMGRARSWEKPGPGIWIDARKAVYVIGGRLHGGMGANEAVPFSSSEQAEAFVAENGGRVVRFDGMPRSYILQQGGELVGSRDADENAREGRHP